MTHGEKLELSKKIKEARLYCDFSHEKLAKMLKIPVNDLIELEAFNKKEKAKQILLEG